MASLLAVQVVDVNRDPVWKSVILVTDIGSSLKTALIGAEESGSSVQAPKVVFDLGTATLLTIEFTAPKFFGYAVTLKRDLAAGTLEVNARSPIWGLFNLESSGELGVMLQLVARRLRPAPLVMAPPPPARDLASPVVDDPAGIVLDRNRLVVGLFDDKATAFPVVLEREILGNADASNWDRFRAVTRDVNPRAADGGHAFHWLEYGDPDGFKMLLAIWVVNRAGARPDGKVDLHFFFGPPTDIDFYAPPSLHPYKRKRSEGRIIQPYSQLGYSYLSPGGSPGSDFGIAYQAMASDKSHVIIMPINAYGYRGPILCRQGLHRLALEVAAYVGDNTRNTPPPSSPFAAGNRQAVNRLAVSGYSAGAAAALKLFRHSTISELAESYRGAKHDSQAQDFAKRLSGLTVSLWQSPPGDFDRRWAEFYSIDGFYGSNEHTAFPIELAPWFASDPERILRVYATDGRMKSAPDVVANKLADVFRGVTPKPTARASNAAFKAEEWHRADGRATLAWFTESYMTFTGVPFMPTNIAHHTIPRVVLSHATAQSKLLQL